MRLTALVIATTMLSLATMSGLATAGSGGEELLRLDLTPAGGSVYYLGCVSGSKVPTECHMLGIWEQTNPLDGLQTSVYDSGDQSYDPDDPVLS